MAAASARSRNAVAAWLSSLRSSASRPARDSWKLMLVMAVLSPSLAASAEAAWKSLDSSTTSPWPRQLMTLPLELVLGHTL
ncbi:hypothetical protein A8B93_15420 [Bordetella pertussis]|nr:hypothetical protein A8B93_15420 [Bordetella pertussis]